jgi:hypothetical protein
MSGANRNIFYLLQLADLYEAFLQVPSATDTLTFLWTKSAYVDSGFIYKEIKNGVEYSVFHKRSLFLDVNMVNVNLW